MPNQQGKVSNWIALFGVLVALAALIFAVLQQTGYFNSPSIRPVAHPYTENSCPQSLSFVGNPKFSLLYRNTGDEDTDLLVQIDSKELKFQENLKRWLLEVDRDETPFNFIILKNETALPTLTNFTISYYHQYHDDKEIITSGYFSCPYKKASNYDYNLIS